MKKNLSDPKRIPEGELILKDIRYLALVEVDLLVLFRRWGRPDIVADDLAEWLCFAFSLPNDDKFALQREAQHPPTPGFLLSVTSGLFSSEAPGKLAAALDVPGIRILEVSDEVIRK